MGGERKYCSYLWILRMILEGGEGERGSGEERMRMDSFLDPLSLQGRGSWVCV